MIPNVASPGKYDPKCCFPWEFSAAFQQGTNVLDLHVLKIWPQQITLIISGTGHTLNQNIAEIFLGLL